MSASERVSLSPSAEFIPTNSIIDSAARRCLKAIVRGMLFALFLSTLFISHGYYRNKMSSSKGMSRTKSNQSGFTLIELLAAIGVAGLLMVIAMPFFTKTLPALRLTDAARQVATELQQVRMRAIAQSIPHQISFATTTYVVQRCNGMCADDGGNMALPEGITVTPPSTPPQFQPRGTVSSAATTIRLSNGTNNKWVCVKIVGRINV